MPMGMGCSVVAMARKSCSALVATVMGGLRKRATSPPETTATMGTTMMSSLVLPFTRVPSSAATMAAMYAPSGPPLTKAGTKSAAPVKLKSPE